MGERRQLAHLTNASGSFHAEVIAARLEAEGIASELRTVGGWPWPGTVQVYVRADDLAVASELMLFDRVEAVFQAG